MLIYWKIFVVESVVSTLEELTVLANMWFDLPIVTYYLSR